MSIMSFETRNGKSLPSPLTTSDVRVKINGLEAACHRALLGEISDIPAVPGRDVEVRALKDLPLKKGLASFEGQARLLHDLASIELQAMELAYRSLNEFPEAPKAFREQLANVALEESHHLKDCLDTIEELGFSWGQWPVHLSLWNCVEASDTLIDRLLIVHRFLEGSGLDAGDTLLVKLSGVSNKRVRSVVRRIHEEELGHVQFGSYWFKEFCLRERRDADEHFTRKLFEFRSRLPRRLEPVKSSLRLQAGFSLSEVESLKKLREHWQAEIKRLI